jgi:lantibiotic modifying enzyme
MSPQDRRRHGRLTILTAAATLLVVAGSPSCKKAPPGPYRAAAGQAAAWIAASAVKGPDGTSWPAVPMEPRPATIDLYSGVPGVVLFFLQAHVSTGAPAYLEQARGGADFLLVKMNTVEGMGLYEGLSGIAFALEETYKAAKDGRYRQGFLDCLGRIRAAAHVAPGGIEWSPTTDVISGGAGTGLFLLYAFHETGDRTWLDLAAKAGSRLAQLGRPENGGLKWAMDPSFPRLMPNFSHGTAGIAYFLAALFRETKRPEFLEAALAGAKYLLSIANTQGESCFIFHDEPDNTGLYYLGWCHGPVGTARLFFLLSKVTGDRSWLGWVRNSAHGLLVSGIPEKETPGFWNNAGICCGLAGVGEFFLDLYWEMGDRAYLDFAKRVAVRLLAKAAVVDLGMSWVQAEHRTRPDYLFAQTGYMQGAAGIGTFLLRLADAAKSKPERIVFPDTPFTR